MPELPEVETIRQDLAQKILKKRILKVDILDSRVIRSGSGREFSQNLTNKTVQDITRRGKAIIIHFSEGGYLIVQPMMTGQLIHGTGSYETARTKATKVTFHLSNGDYLNYNDHRLFGRLNWVRDLKDVKFFQSIGPEPFDREFSVDWIKARLKKRQIPIKSLLMNQSFVAGIGNIYASEILFHSRINPKRRARTIKPGEIKVLRQKTLDVLKRAIRLRGTSMNTYRDASGEKGNFMAMIKVYGREQEQCFICRTPIKKIVQSGRSTFFCQRCQG